MQDPSADDCRWIIAMKPEVEIYFRLINVWNLCPLSDALCRCFNRHRGLWYIQNRLGDVVVVVVLFDTD